MHSDLKKSLLIPSIGHLSPMSPFTKYFQHINLTHKKNGENQVYENSCLFIEGIVNV